jgi:hypothetical protein
MTLDVHPSRVAGSHARWAGIGVKRFLLIAEQGPGGAMHSSRSLAATARSTATAAVRLRLGRRSAGRGWSRRSVFGAYPRHRPPGLFRITADSDGWSSKQLHLPGTDVLITLFLMPEGVGEVWDFMPPPRSGETAHRQRIICRVVDVRGRSASLST